MKYYMVKVHTKDGLKNYKVSKEELDELEKHVAVLACTYIGEGD